MPYTQDTSFGMSLDCKTGSHPRITLRGLGSKITLRPYGRVKNCFPSDVTMDRESHSQLLHHLSLSCACVVLTREQKLLYTLGLFPPPFGYVGSLLHRNLKVQKKPTEHLSTCKLLSKKASGRKVCKLNYFWLWRTH